MARTSTTGNGNKSAKPGREDRLKAALKANMARRKAQTRARMGADEPSARMGADEPSARMGADEPSARMGADEPSARMGADEPSARMGANEPDARTGADETNQADQSAHDAKGRTDG